MGFDLFKKIIDSCPEAEVVQTQGFGEPLLYPHIIEAVEYANKKRKNTVFYTNAALLNEDMAIKLLEAQLDRIIFSVDECEKELFEQLRRGLSWKSVYMNIKHFQQLRNEGKYKTQTTIRLTRTKENSNRIPLIRDFWRRRVDNVAVYPEVYIPSPNILKKTKWISGPPTGCYRVNQHLSVKSNGDLVLCCRDWFHIYKMGNLYERDILTEYNNETFNKVRQSLKTGFNAPALCRYCVGNVPPRRLPDE